MLVQEAAVLAVPPGGAASLQVFTTGAAASRIIVGEAGDGTLLLQRARSSNSRPDQAASLAGPVGSGSSCTAADGEVADVAGRSKRGPRVRTADRRWHLVTANTTPLTRADELL